VVGLPPLMAQFSMAPGPAHLACAGAIAFTRSHGHLPLLLGIQGETEWVAKGHQRPLHGIGLGFLEGGLMGLAQISIDPMASAAALTDQGRPPTGSDGDANPDGVGDAPAGLLVPAAITRERAGTISGRIERRSGDGEIRGRDCRRRWAQGPWRSPYFTSTNAPLRR
jgi:hypothetical protein